MSLRHRIWILGLVLVGGLVALHPNAESDIFFHLELGRSVLRHAARVVPEPFALPGFEPECMAPAWLWDVLAYGVYVAGGFTALSLLNLLSAMASAWLIAKLGLARAGAAGFLGWATVSTATLICVSARFAMRPQTLAIALLAGYLLLLTGYAAGTARERRYRGIGLLLLALAWAQLHGSFVLSPVLFAIVVGSAWWSRWTSRTDGAAAISGEQRNALRWDMLLLCALLGTLLSSAAGLDVVAYVAGHGYGGAVQFIAEMRPPAWADLISLQGASGKALALLWLLSLFGLTRDARFQWESIALALLGHLMLSRAQRFVAEDAILCMPLALAGAANLAAWAQTVFVPAARRALALGALLALAALLALQLSDSREHGGAFGVGLDETALPRLASSYLARMPEGTRVLSAFNAGPALGFWSHGKLRTYVDGRTPLYFDDADYAVEREAFTNADALERAIRRFGVHAAVVERAHGVCDLLAKHWQPVVIEARYTTFVPPGIGAAISGIDPCGPEFVHHPRQASDLAALDSGIAQLAKLHASPFLDLLRAESLLLSGQDPKRAMALLDGAESPAYPQAHRRLRILALASIGELDAAYALMHDALSQGDVSVLALVTAPQLGTLDLGRARELFELGVLALGEGTPPATRSMLAALCARQNDATCARYNAVRAAVRAAPNVAPTLEWLTQHAATARMRADAQAWLDLLQSEQPHGPP